MAARISWHRLDMEQNYVTVTQCIRDKKRQCSPCFQIRYSNKRLWQTEFSRSIIMWYFDNLVTKRHSVFVRVCGRVLYHRQTPVFIRPAQNTGPTIFFLYFQWSYAKKTARICDKYYKIMQNKIKIKLRWWNVWLIRQFRVMSTTDNFSPQWTNFSRLVPTTVVEKVNARREKVRNW